MQKEISSLLIKCGVPSEIASLVETPQDSSRGDFAFPCFALAKLWKKNPALIASEIVGKIGTSKGFEKIEAVGPYVNFFVDRKKITEDVLKKIEKEKGKYGSSKIGKNNKIVIDLSSPNIAKPFGIGHLRSTIIGNSLANLGEFNGYKAVKINYLGDWGTQFGKMIVGYKRFGNMQELKKNPIHYMLKLYIEGNKEDFEQEARDWFKKLENGDARAIKLWKKFKEISLKNFNDIYKTLGINFHVLSGESLYEKKMKNVFKELEKKRLLERNDGALIVNLEKYDLGVALIEKNDGTKLYITRDLAAAIDRHEKYKFSAMLYEVGQEQKLHFKQLFKILELMGYSWAKNCVHVDHGLYLGQDGKKFATRKGKTVFMEEVLAETIALAKEEINKRGDKLSENEINERARKIAISAIFYGDLKNYRSHDMVFDLERFLAFEGDTGPYLLYSYARANSILRKSKNKAKLIVNQKIDADARFLDARSVPQPKGCGFKQTLRHEITEKEKRLISVLGKLPEVVKHSYEQLAPNLIANYTYELAQTFNEFYHACPVIGSDSEGFRLRLVWAFCQVMENAMHLLGIPLLKEM